jgi:hypothetical protein
MTTTLLVTTAHSAALPSPLTVVVAVAAVAYVLWSRTQGRPLRLTRMLALPAVLTVIGLTDLTGSGDARFGPKDVAFLLISVAISAVLGAARGRTIELYPVGGQLWRRYRRSTVGLWIVLIASKLLLAGVASAAGASAGGGTNTLFLSLGVSLLAEAAIVRSRALSTGVPLATSPETALPEAPSAPAQPVHSSLTALAGVAATRERPVTGPLPADVQPQPRLRHERGTRHHSGPAHRLIGTLLEAQAQPRAAARDR